MSVLSLQINQISIRQDDNNRYCLNDLHKASGNLPKNSPTLWLQNQHAKELIIEIETDDIGNPTSKKSVEIIRGRGKNQGTYAVKELVYAYAMWISAKFHLAVIRAYDALITNPQPPLITPPERKTKKAFSGCLTLEMQDNIKAKVKARVEHLPHNKQAGQIIKQWSAIKQKFGCTYKEIPAEEYLNVISLIERLPIEGELLEPPKPMQEIATTTENDYLHARESLANIRKAAEAGVDESMLNAMFSEIEALEKCLVSAWTHFSAGISKTLARREVAKPTAHGCAVTYRCYNLFFCSTDFYEKK